MKQGFLKETLSKCGTSKGEKPKEVKKPIKKNIKKKQTKLDLYCRKKKSRHAACKMITVTVWHSS